MNTRCIHKFETNKILQVLVPALYTDYRMNCGRLGLNTMQSKSACAENSTLCRHIKLVL